MLCWHHLSADRPGGFALRGGLSGRFGAPLSSLAYDSALPPSGCCRVTSSMRCKGSSCAGAGRQGAWLASADTRQPHGRLALGKKAELWSGVGDCLMHCCDLCAYSAVLNRGSDFVTDHHAVYPQCSVYFTKCGLVSSDGVCTYLFPCLQFGVAAFTKRVHFQIAFTLPEFPTVGEAVWSLCKCAANCKYDVIHDSAYIMFDVTALAARAAAPEAWGHANPAPDGATKGSL